MSYIIDDFMLDKYKLTGNALLLYALLYSFQEYSGTIAFLAVKTGMTKRTVLQKLAELQEKGLIEKKQKQYSWGTKTIYCSTEKRDVGNELKLQASDLNKDYLNFSAGEEYYLNYDEKRQIMERLPAGLTLQGNRIMKL